MNTRLHNQVTQEVATRSVSPTSTSVLQRACACGQHTAGSKCSACEDKRLLQRSTADLKSEASNPPENVPPIVHEVLRSPGQPLDAGTRAFFEPRFGHEFSRVLVHTAARDSVQGNLKVGPANDQFENQADRMAAKLSAGLATIDSSQRYDFSGVRLHFGAQAAASARAVNALAYTVGQNIVFGEGQYAPGTQAGKELLAHELTHVVQQRGAVQAKRIQRRVNPARVSCAHYPRTYPIFRAIHTQDPVGALQTADARATEILSNAIGNLSFVRAQIQAGAQASVPTFDDCMAQSLSIRLLINPEDRNSWTGNGPRTVNRLIRMLTTLRRMLEGGNVRYSCLDSDCEEGDDALMDPAKGFYIGLCRGFWDSNDVNFRALTIIHELAHIYYDTEDRGFIGLGSSYCIEGFLSDMNMIAQEAPYDSECRGNRMTACH